MNRDWKAEAAQFRCDAVLVSRVGHDMVGDLVPMRDRHVEACEIAARVCEERTRWTTANPDTVGRLLAETGDELLDRILGAPSSPETNR